MHFLQNQKNVIFSALCGKEMANVCTRELRAKHTLYVYSRLEQINFHQRGRISAEGNWQISLLRFLLKAFHAIHLQWKREVICVSLESILRKSSHSTSFQKELSPHFAWFSSLIPMGLLISSFFSSMTHSQILHNDRIEYHFFCIFRQMRW